MVGKRSVYLNIVVPLVACGLLFFLNATVFPQAIPDVVYRLLKFPAGVPDGSVATVAADEALERENAALREQLRVTSRKPMNVELARIISWERNAIGSTVVIDQGEHEGVRPGLVVLAPGNVLAGSIAEVFPHSARVILVDDPRLVISVRLLDTAILAESKGLLKRQIALNLIAHTDVVAEDTLVVTSGLDGFPAGLALGRISRVSMGSHTLFQEVEGEVLFALHEAPILFIVR